MRTGPTVLDLCLILRVCMFGLFVSHPSSDPPPGLGGSGVGNLMGDLCRWICPQGLIGYVDDSNPEDVDGVAPGIGRSMFVGSGKVGDASPAVICLVVDDLKPDEVDGVSVGISCDGTAEMFANVSRDIVEGPNSGQVYGLCECSGRMSP